MYSTLRYVRPLFGRRSIHRVRLYLAFGFAYSLRNAYRAACRSRSYGVSVLVLLELALIAID
jgi:hypothetical protein